MLYPPPTPSSTNPYRLSPDGVQVYEMGSCWGVRDIPSAAVLTVLTAGWPRRYHFVAGGVDAYQPLGNYHIERLYPSSADCCTQGPHRQSPKRASRIMEPKHL